MMARMQITLDPEMQRRARQRASDLGVSFADLASVFDLGRSNGSGIAKDKNEMIAAAFASARGKGQPLGIESPPGFHGPSMRA